LTLLGGLGVALLALAGVIALVGVVVALPRALRVRRAALATIELAATYRLLLGISATELQLAALERNQLLRPYRRVRRWVTHPLTVALAESWARRRTRAREARLEAMGLR
jgi:hypothetical protein